MLYQLKVVCPQTVKAIAKSYAKTVAGIGQGLSKPAGRLLAWCRNASQTRTICGVPLIRSCALFR